MGWKAAGAVILVIVVAVAMLFCSGRVIVVPVKVQEEFTVNSVIASAIRNLTIKVYGKTTFDRSVDLNDSYVRLFYAEDRGDFAMALIGVEDIDAPLKPDGWTDVLLPVFYDKASNAGNVTYPIIFIDGAFSGGYSKELWLRTGNGTELLFVYSVEDGLRERDRTERVSVGYIEYDPVKDLVYMPAP